VAEAKHIPEAHCLDHFELGLLLHFGFCVIRTRTNDVPLTDFNRKMVDAETLSFLAYFAIEVAYTVVYTLIDPAWVSLMQSFYLSVPVALFLAYVFVFRSRHKEVRSSHHSSGRKASMSPGLVSEARGAHSSSTLNDSTPQLPQIDFSLICNHTSWHADKVTAFQANGINIFY
jgi:hypothetical protein